MSVQVVPEGVAACAQSLQTRIPSVLRCGLLIAGIKLSLKTLGFSRTLQQLHRRTRNVLLVSDADRATVARVEYQVALAGALYPGRALCLEQSLALWYVLRCVGVLVELRMGVQSHPFAAHCWIEYRGEVINDVSEHVKWFTPLSSPAI